MKSLTRGNIKMALGAVRATRWRSLLTMLGVVIGVLSVVTIVSLGEGIKHQIGGQIDRLGRDLITIRPGRVTASTTASLNVVSGLSAASTFDTHDVQVVQAAPGVKLAVPLAVVSGDVEVSGRQFGDTIVIGSGEGIPSVLNQRVRYGDFFTSSDAQNDVAVVGASVAQRLFGEAVPLGHSLTFRGQKFIVRGILDQFDSSPFSLDLDFNNAIFIPYSVAAALHYNSAPIYEILAKPSDPGQTASVVQTIQAQLLRAHGGQVDFSVLKQNESLAVASGVLNLLTRLISGIAAISLFVGGIGIMNIMLVSVTERTHEIGIRKAIGATNRQILGQFLVEATVLSLAGGLLGVAGSLIVNVLLRIFTHFTPVISWQVMSLAVGVSLAVGIIFGITPALQAARKDPIDALRHE